MRRGKGAASMGLGIITLLNEISDNTKSLSYLVWMCKGITRKYIEEPVMCVLILVSRQVTPGKWDAWHCKRQAALIYKEEQWFKHSYLQLRHPSSANFISFLRGVRILFDNAQRFTYKTSNTDINPSSSCYNYSDETSQNRKNWLYTDQENNT